MEAAEMKPAEPTAADAVAALVEEGATVEGDDVASVLLAAVAALDMAADKGLPLGSARILALRFGDDGEISAHALDDAQAKAALPMLTAEGVKSEAFSMDDIKKFIDAAEKDDDDADDEPEAPEPAGVM
jgi:hypothetical protein